MKGKQSGSEQFFFDIFRENYTRIQRELKVRHVGIRMYDKYKKPDTPHSSTIIRRCKCGSYNELLLACGYRTDGSIMEASVHISFDDRAGRYMELEAAINGKSAALRQSGYKA